MRIPSDKKTLTTCSAVFDTIHTDSFGQICRSSYDL